MVAFSWDIPERFNIGVDVADRYPNARALIEIDPSGGAREFTFDAISALSNRLANVLVARGLQQGDRIAILLPQRHETAVTHVAAWKAGLISVPLFTLFGEEALEFRLQNSGRAPSSPIADQLPKLKSLRERLPELQTVLCVDGLAEGALDLHALLAKASDRFEPRTLLPTTRRSSSTPAHHRPAQGRASRPPGAARDISPASVSARRVSAVRRPLLDAGGLGVDRWPLRRPHACLASRRLRGRAPPAQVRPGRGDAANGAPWGAQRLHAPTALKLLRASGAVEPGLHSVDVRTRAW